MSKFARAEMRASSVVDVSAERFWAVLIDWTAVSAWAADGFFRVEAIDAASSRPARALYPNTKGLQLPPGVAPSVMPDRVVERLLHSDPEARVIFYNIEGPGPFGVRNYLAVTTVDEVDAGRSRVTCWSRGDYPAEIPIESARAFIEGFYEFGIIQGIAAYAKSR